jgi:hypothetical protein
MGRGYRGSTEALGADRVEAWASAEQEDYVRLEIVLDHEYPLEVGDWDIPYYMDRDWPIAKLDLISGLERRWPISLFGLVVGNQRAIDTLSLGRLSSCVNRDRTLLLYDATLEADVVQRIIHGSVADGLPIKRKGNMPLEQHVQALDLGHGAYESAMAERAYHEQEMEQTTGASTFLTGGNEQGAKDRSATATQTRSDASKTRVEHFTQLVEDFLTDARRHEAIALLLDADGEDLDKVVPPADINLFYISVRMADGSEIPVVRPNLDDNEDVDPATLPITLEDISPGAGRYFEADEAGAVESFMAAQTFWEDLQALAQEGDLRAIEVVQELTEGGVAEEDGLPIGIEAPAAVTASRVWQDTESLSDEDVMREMSYEIASGGGVKVDREQQAEAANNALQTIGPILSGMGDIEGFNALLQRADEANDVPRDQRVQISPPPPPEEQGQPQGGE